MGSRITGKQVIGYKYYLTELMGLGVGPIDFIKKIIIGDQTAWEGKLTDGQTTSVSKPNLFGGKKGEGGVDGKITLYGGGRDQIIPDSVKSKINHDDYTTVSDFRGTSCLWFDGMGCSMTWYPKPWTIDRVRRMSGWDGDVWQPSLCEIDMTGTVSEEIVISTEQIVNDKEKYDQDDGDGHTGRYHNVTETIYAMNPAHIIYQLLTDRTFGRGYSRESIDEVSFLAAATQLKAEGFGLCYSFNPAEKKVAEAVSEIISTIGAGLYPDRTSGLMTLKLIRDDYDPDLLPIFTRDNGIVSIERAQLSAAGTSVNELHIQYHSPISNSTRTVCRSNNASIMSLGYKVTNTVSYDSIPTSDLAARVGDRDLKAQDPSIKRYTMKFDRRLWKASPAGVIKVYDDLLKIYNEVLRITDVKDTSVLDGTMTISLASDVFRLPATTNNVDIIPDNRPTQNVPTAASTYLVQEASYRDAVLLLGSDDATKLDRTLGTSVTYVSQPNGSTESFSVDTSANGGDWSSDSDTAPFTEIAPLTEALDEWSTSVKIEVPDYMEAVPVGSAIQIDSEVMRVDAVSDDLTTYTVARGCGDTIPAKHSVKANVFFIDTGSLVDDTEYGLYETVKTRIISHTSTSSTDPVLAPVVSLVIAGRQGKPYPPANVKISGNRFTESFVVDGDMVVTWNNRNRLISQDKLIGHTEDGQDIETGCEVYVAVYDGDKNVAWFSTTGDSVTWTKDQQTEAFKSNPIPTGSTKKVTVRIGTKFDPNNQPLDSWQAYEIETSVTAAASDVIKPATWKTQLTWKPASLNQVEILPNALRINTAWKPAVLSHPTEGLGANTQSVTIAWQKAELVDRPTFIQPNTQKVSVEWQRAALNQTTIIPAATSVKISWKPATLTDIQVEGERQLEDIEGWRTLEDGTDRSLEQ